VPDGVLVLVLAPVLVLLLLLLLLKLKAHGSANTGIFEAISVAPTPPSPSLLDAGVS
jgi:hypothetical protein